ncbi:MAG: DUF3137 domain-containing protein [Clostridium sp.]|nr:DUF3137 domain-containing protein [Clostridium sp.]
MKDSIIIRTIRRNQYIIKFTNLLTISYFLLPFVFLFGFLGIMDGRTADGFFKFIICVVWVIFLLIMNKFASKVEKKLKNFIGENVVKQIISEKIDIQAYVPNNMISTKSIKAAGITPHYDRISGSDYIKGTYHGQAIEYCDIKMEQKHESTDKNGHTSTHYTTVFKGPFMRIPLGEELNGYIKILERKNKRKRAGFIADLFNSVINKKEKNVELENEAFNNKFQVKTDNEELAFYILTPQFMENIMKADEYAEGYTNISFINGTANIAINNGKDAFEIKKTLYTKKQLDKNRDDMRKDLNLFLSIADEILQKDRLFHSKAE